MYLLSITIDLYLPFATNLLQKYNFLVKKTQVYTLWLLLGHRKADR